MTNKFGVFLIGGAVGAIAALLAAPRSGRETRAMVADRANAVLDDAQGWSAQASDRAQNFYHQAAAKGAEVVGDVTAKSQEIADEVVARGHAAVDSVQEAAGSMKPVFTEKNDELREKIEAARQRIAAQVAKNVEASSAAEAAAPAEPIDVAPEAVETVAAPAPAAQPEEPADKQ